MRKFITKHGRSYLFILPSMLIHGLHPDPGVVVVCHLFPEIQPGPVVYLDKQGNAAVSITAKKEANASMAG